MRIVMLNREVRSTLSRLVTAICAAAVIAGGASAEPLDFNRDIRPILSDNCFKCHGFDDNSRKGKLRLDVRDKALKGGKSGDAAIVPGKPDESQLVARIFATDPDEIMPPSSAKGPITETQKRLLKRWVAEGAEYKTHWAFVAPVQAPLPAVKQPGWARNEIDRFVLARLEREGLAPSKEADKYTLCRRLYLDLIGLPPTPEEADRFVQDQSPGAYDALVEQLLASPRYGERWARRWLDLARYADTNGFEKDRPRSIWPYRDWVIKAFNSDMPFDRFTVEQLAGDMLPNATADQKIATGFHRNTMRNEEGGIDPLEYRFYSVVDRTAVTGITWMGLTVGCAQCHTHKYDPITQKDYYSLLAFLNNCDEPEVDLPTEQATAQRADLDRQIAALKSQLADKWPTGATRWWTPDATVSSANGATPKKQADGSWVFAGASPETDQYTFTFTAPGVAGEGQADAVDVLPQPTRSQPSKQPALLEQPAAGPPPQLRKSKAPPAVIDRIRIEALTDDGKGPGRTPHGNFVLTGLNVSVDRHDGRPAEMIAPARAEADFSQKNYAVDALLTGSGRGGWGIAPQEHKSHTATFHFDIPVASPPGATWTITLRQEFGARHTLARVRLSLGREGVGRSTTGRPTSRPAAQLAGRFAEWEQSESAKAIAWTTLTPDQIESSGPTLRLLDDHSVLASGDITKSDKYTLTFRDQPKGITAIRLEALPHESLPKHGPGMIYYEGPFGDFSLSNLTLLVNGAEQKWGGAVANHAAGKNTAATAIDDNLQTGWMINGGQGKAHQAIFTLGAATCDAGALTVNLFFEKYYACALGHFRISVTTDPRGASATPLPPDVAAALLVPSIQRSEAERSLLMNHFLWTAPELAAARKDIESLEQRMAVVPSTLEMVERPAGHQRVTHLHHRGEFLSPEDVVQPDVPGFLPPLPVDAPRNRLTLARWLVSRDNPLTARVAVNRQWQAFFGRGIVKTVQDFGYQGDLPTHPELLDWLAVEFMNRGWSFKQLDRLIVGSATYRQASAVSVVLLAKDPENLLLARGPRFRVEAEIVRDAALRKSDLLSDKMYGPSVFPPQIPSVTTEGTYGPLQWKVSTGEDRYRRSLYTFTKRTAPFAIYNTFDAPTGEACIARREVSDTPLQALTLLNDEVFMDAARSLGKRFGAGEAGAASDESRAAELFRRCIIRPPAAEELASLVEFVHQQRTRFTSKELDAVKIAGDTGGNVLERAVWTVTARAVLNLDEAVTKD